MSDPVLDLLRESRVGSFEGSNFSVNPQRKIAQRSFNEAGVYETGEVDPETFVPRSYEFRELLVEKLETDQDYTQEDLHRDLEEGFIPGDEAVELFLDEAEDLPDWAAYSVEDAFGDIRDGEVLYNVNFAPVVLEDDLEEAMAENRYGEFFDTFPGGELFIRVKDAYDHESIFEKAYRNANSQLNSKNVTISGEVGELTYQALMGGGVGPR